MTHIRLGYDILISRFATRYDHGDIDIRIGIIEFAIIKLLCSAHPDKLSDLSPDRRLACLAVRLGLDFRATGWVQQQSERTQVERHMRLCIVASSGFTEVLTISPSEPLLAEAAFCVATYPNIAKWTMAAALLHHVKSSYLSAGDRGEVVAALLVTLARDAACSQNKKPVHIRESPSRTVDQHKVDGAHRVVSVVSFLQALLGDEATALLAAKPYRARPGEDATSLQSAFENASIWFNHITKVESASMLERKNLCNLVARGAAMLCANGQCGVDLVIPIVFNDSLAPKNISAILIQVKNELKFNSRASCSHLFASLDPFHVGLFGKDDAAEDLKPVIRMVFALAAKRSDVSYPAVEKKSPRTESSSTAYDIYCGGMSASTFAVVSKDDVPTYEALLLRSLKLSAAYSEGQTAVTSQLLRGMYPTAAPSPDHAGNFMLGSRQSETD